MNDIVNYNFPTHRWMSVTPEIENLSLLELTLPGTHNAGCDYQAVYDVLPGVVSPVTASLPIRHWAACQHKSFYEQMNYGSRALDVRLVFDHVPEGKDPFSFHHNGFRSSRKLQSLLADLNRFLNENRDEFIVLYCSHFQNGSGTFNFASFNHAVLTSLGDRLIPASNNHLNLSELKRTSALQRVLIACPPNNALDKQMFHYPAAVKWSGESLTSASQLQRFITGVMKSPPSRWEPWVLSATSYSWYGGPVDIHPELNAMFDPEKNNWAENCNIIGVDFLEESNIVGYCRMASLRNAARKRRAA